MLCALLVLPLALSACSSATDPVLLGVGGLLTDACWVQGRPQVVSLTVRRGEIDVAYYRSDLTLTQREFSTKAAPLLSALPDGTISWPVTAPTACD